MGFALRSKLVSEIGDLFIAALEGDEPRICGDISESAGLSPGV